jgi:propane monooxygenase small subunit
MQSWLEQWTPVSIAAARTLQPIWSQPGEKVIRFEESLEHSRRRYAELLGDLGLDPKELDR